MPGHVLHHGLMAVEDRLRFENRSIRWGTLHVP
jgi:hypothetical protein